MLVKCIDGLRGIQRHDAFGVSGGQFLEALSDLLVESSAFDFEAVHLGLRGVQDFSESAEALIDGEVEEEGEVRPAIADGVCVEVADELQVHAACVALVGGGGVREAVAEHDMTGGQFEMRMVDETRAGEGKNRGLDLTVYCALTGKEREIRTLSGGESFMAALSLALGMADQIRAGSSAFSPDIMFIDEGFGSLDDQSLDQAMRVLETMSGGRLIGIISHVGELKRRIERQVIVKKEKQGGSSIRMEL